MPYHALSKTQQTQADSGESRGGGEGREIFIAVVTLTVVVGVVTACLQALRGCFELPTSSKCIVTRFSRIDEITHLWSVCLSAKIPSVDEASFERLVASVVHYCGNVTKEAEETRETRITW